MIKLNAMNEDELELEIQEERTSQLIGREAVLCAMIGIEQGVDEVQMDVVVGDGWIELGMSIETKNWREIFEKNEDIMIELEEYELLSLMKQMLLEDKPFKKEIYN